MTEVENCKLCNRNKSIILIDNLTNTDLDMVGYNDDYCKLCNLNYKFKGIFTPITDCDVHRIGFILFVSKYIKKYFNDEFRIQQTKDIKLWKNDKYFNDWYKDSFDTLKNKKLVKDVLLLYYDNFCDMSSGTIKYKGDDHLYKWLIKNYYFLKNGVKW